MRRRFGPKEPDHPSIGEPCPACKKPFLAGDYTTLVPIGPGGDAGEQELAREGRPYIGMAVEVHWTCATGEPVMKTGSQMGDHTKDVLPEVKAALREAYWALRRAQGMAGVGYNQAAGRFYNRIKVLYWETGSLLEDMGVRPEEDP